jgi:hypothetical protein
MNVAQLKNQKLFNNNSDTKDSDKYAKPKALKEKADKTFYLGYDFMGKNNPWFHHEEYYSYDAVKTPRSTPMINNISLVVRSSNFFFSLSTFFDLSKSLKAGI